MAWDGIFLTELWEVGMGWDWNAGFEGFLNGMKTSAGSTVWGRWGNG